MLTGGSDAKIELEDVVATWLFEEEKEGGVGADTSGNGHHGELVNRPKVVDGKFGKALQFNGKDNLAAGASFVKVPHDEALNLPDAVSISAWVIRRKFDFLTHEARSQTILAKGGDWAPLTHSGYGFALHEVLDNMFFFYFKDGWRGAATVPDQEWHHYAVTAKTRDKDPALYIDGELQTIVHRGGKANKIEWTLNEGPLEIGGQTRADEWFSSNIIDDVGLFNRVLTQEEVQRLTKGLQTAVFAVSPSGKLATTWAEIKQRK
jgi:hypothetical protein